MSKNSPHFDPKMLEAWQRGGLAPLALGPMDHLTALALRHRLYRVRTQMRQVSHPATAVANLATIAIRRHEDGTATLILYPTNQFIDAALERAGITANDPPPLE